MLGCLLSQQVSLEVLTMKFLFEIYWKYFYEPFQNLWISKIVGLNFEAVNGTYILFSVGQRINAFNIQLLYEVPIYFLMQPFHQ